MMRDRLIRIGTRAVAVIMIVLSALSLSYANERTQDSITKPHFHSAPQVDPILQNSATKLEPEDGFFGRLWGIRPEGFEDARFITDLAPKLMIYSVDLDVSPIFGTAPAYSCQQLVFSKEQGLVQARIGFDATEYDRVEERLIQLLGEPNPVIYELWAARNDFFKRAEWFAGRNTRVVLLLRATGASIEISKRKFILPEGPGFTETIAAAMLKQAEEYDRQNRILEASSVYQTLLNSTDSYQFFTQTAEDHLTAYSSLQGAVDHLGEDGGFSFYGFRNIFSGCSGQQWVRIDLSAAAQAELQKQRPTGIEPQNELDNLSAVLCRVRIVPATGKYSVVEQIWLDSSNRIIGGRPAWASQEMGWPVPYIKQACERFLEAWFSIEYTDGSVSCK